VDHITGHLHQAVRDLIVFQSVEEDHITAHPHQAVRDLIVSPSVEVDQMAFLVAWTGSQ
jgi:hypothetical protein